MDVGMRHSTTLYNAQQGHTELRSVWEFVKPWLIAGHRLNLTIKTETRSTAQNSRMWAMLTEVSNQVDWYGRKLTPEAWKCVFSASLKKQDVVPGLHGDFVVLGQSTSQMTVAEMTELMDLMEAFGAEKGVRFTTQEEVPA
jgi:hypothetical protein